MSRSHTTRLLTLAPALLLAGVLAGQTGTTDQEELQERVDRISRQVAGLRQLELKKRVRVQMRTRDEIEKFVLATLDKQCPPEKFASDSRAFKALGMLPPDYQLRKELVAIYREQIAGLYDPESGSMILLRGSPFGGMQDMLLAHELTHALQDQHFNLKRMVDESSDTVDESFTVMAVVEGGATAVMMDYGAAYPRPKTEGAPENKNAPAATGSDKLGNAPPILRHSIFGPYLRGLAFTKHFQSRGWKRIDAIYRDFPMSSEQIMHPEKYYPQRDFPTRIDMKNPEALAAEVAPGRKWKKASDDVLGEIGVVAMVETLGAALKDRDLSASAHVTAAGWDGDRLLSFEGGPKAIVVIWVTTWDTPEDASEMQNSLKKWVTWRRQADTDGRGGPWRAAVMRPDDQGKPGKDVICVAVRTPDSVEGPITQIPVYTKTVIRNPRRMTHKPIAK